LIEGSDGAGAEVKGQHAAVGMERHPGTAGREVEVDEPLAARVLKPCLAGLGRGGDLRAEKLGFRDEALGVRHDFFDLVQLAELLGLVVREVGAGDGEAGIVVDASDVLEPDCAAIAALGFVFRAAPSAGGLGGGGAHGGAGAVFDAELAPFSGLVFLRQGVLHDNEVGALFHRGDGLRGTWGLLFVDDVRGLELHQVGGGDDFFSVSEGER
jgi:hypothetical protein